MEIKIFFEYNRRKFYNTEAFMKNNSWFPSISKKNNSEIIINMNKQLQKEFRNKV